MDSPDPLMTRLWFLIFRVLSFGAVVMGTLAAVAGVIVAVVSVLPRTQAPPGLTLSYGVFFIVGGVAFVLIGVRGSRMRTRRDLDADISRTASDRDSLERWINR
jgi:cytochrome c biogenesis factor